MLSREILAISCDCDRKWSGRKPEETEPVSVDTAQLLWFAEPVCAMYPTVRRT